VTLGTCRVLELTLVRATRGPGVVYLNNTKESCGRHFSVKEL